MNVVALVMAAGLGAGLMAIVHEVCRWDAARRLAARMGERPAGAVHAAAPAGRHHEEKIPAPLPQWDGGGQRTPPGPDPEAWAWS